MTDMQQDKELPEIDKKYWRREYEGLALPKMHQVKVVKIFKMQDGSATVRFRYNWPFPIDKDVTLNDFWNHVGEELSS